MAGCSAIRDDTEHQQAMQSHGIAEIDLAAINLYPFEETVARGADSATTVENIDIGGPAMIRASAKNHAYVTAITDPADYERVLEALKTNDGCIPLALRKELAALAFARTAAYDAAVSGWFAGELDLESPRHRAFGGRLHAVMRYGENPHQQSAFYTNGDNRPGVAGAQLLQGKQLSYNNINDTDAAFELVSEFDPAAGAACAIIKHANPCGVAVGETLARPMAVRWPATRLPLSAASLPSTSRSTRETALEIVKIFTEVIIAPGRQRGSARDPVGQEEPAVDDHRWPRRSAPAGPVGQICLGRLCWCRAVTTVR
jgi:phosphoribosylaminoimidazolecarboxamide formyltransferase/IMP cyclohydrolase